MLTASSAASPFRLVGGRIPSGVGDLSRLIYWDQQKFGETGAASRYIRLFLGGRGHKLDALRSAHRNVELIELPSEDHWLYRTATRTEMLTAAVAFMEKYDPPS